MPAMADPISIRDRVQVIDQLERTARWANLMATWLSEHGLETEADMVNESAKGLLAACWWLSRPLRRRPPSAGRTASRRPGGTEPHEPGAAVLLAF
jgi:hypothetical protein